MNIEVDFLSMPNVTKLIGSKKINVKLSGRTIEDLIHQIIDKYGEKLGGFLLDKTGKLDLVFQVYLNGKKRIPRDQMDKILADGDKITIMLLVGGG